MPDHVTTWMRSALFEPWLIKTLRAQPGCPGLATEAFDDLAQQCRLRIWSRRERFATRVDQPLTALARRMVQDVVLDFLRCRQRRGKRVVEIDDPDVPLPDACISNPEPIGDAPDPIEAVQRVLAGLTGDEARFARELLTGASVRDAGKTVGWGWRRAERARATVAHRLRLAGLPLAGKGVERA